METLRSHRISSPLGPLHLVASRRGLVALAFGSLPDEHGEATPDPRPFARVEDELCRYFAGRLRRFRAPLDLRGTPFELRVWSALREIPWGETRTYAEIARAIRSPRAFRAVGGANGRNPVAILVPCHRVVATGGGLGGYSAGLHRKRFLLSLEGGETRPEKR